MGDTHRNLDFVVASAELNCATRATERSFGVLAQCWDFGPQSGRARQQNYRFTPPDSELIVGWINVHLEVNWIVLGQSEVRAADVELIRKHTPPVNLNDNPSRLELHSRLRTECRMMASAPI